MPPKVSIELLPLGRCVEVEKGTPLRDLLFPFHVEFPCGGQGRCKGCRVRVLKGNVPVTTEDKVLLSSNSLNKGWRLACCMRALDDLQLEIGQWDSHILEDDQTLNFTPEEGLGVAVDVGTTTIVAQVLDLSTGNVLGVHSALNLQAKHGSDIMTRIHAAVHQGMQADLTHIVRNQIGDMIAQVMRRVSATKDHASSELTRGILVGNTVMHHLFCGILLEPLAEHPFETTEGTHRIFRSNEIGWFDLNATCDFHFLPCMGSFVGSDLLAGAIGQKIHLSNEPCLLVDLGTNGEIILGNREQMLCASTAAGPAFEGAKISMGMRASSGAISSVKAIKGGLDCHILGGGKARGLCGSGLVDATAVFLDQKLISPNGRVQNNQELPLSGNVTLHPCDVPELQLAKGAIAAGIRVLIREWGMEESTIDKIHLAGAFGNYLNLNSARRIGLLNFPPNRIIPAGNSALYGAKQALFTIQSSLETCDRVLSTCQHVSLNDHPEFMNLFIEDMGFPASSP